MVNIHFRGPTFPGGYWGPRTATLDWCEPNYQHSRYVAEMGNTMSNLGTFVFGLLGAQNARRERLPTRYVIAHLALALVAAGSFAFHGTLLYEWQLADELPMIYSASTSAFILTDIAPGFNTFSLPVLVTIIFGDIFFTLTYALLWRHHLYHQIVFAALMLAFPARTAYLLNSPRSSSMTADQRRRVVTICVTGTVLFAAGFAVWNVDNIWCEVWHKYKLVVGWPAAFLLEGHSWWHLLTGLGTCYILTGGNYLYDSTSRSHCTNAGGLGVFVSRMDLRITKSHSALGCPTCNAK